ncbi:MULTISPECIES: Asp23/Gls24 family envelope stress response protein [unclassified Streptomyces]|uniref:Asp23/Gls24 family envelope stress response protein n=1 Tax=unclassified Streptomyces TaxID=2593676 RepID=UPI003D703239
MSVGTGTLGGRPALVPPVERGATRIADRVVAKIASQAAHEAVGALPPDATRPRATVVVHHFAAHVRVHLELGYPCDLAARCRAVRRHVAERVRALVSMDVPEVAVHVERLHPTTAHGTARGRTR